MHALSMGVEWVMHANGIGGNGTFHFLLISSKTINPEVEEMSFGVEGAIWPPFNGKSDGVVRYIM